MAVFRVEKTRDYTVMSNYHLKDNGLTLKSKGLLSMMLSLPNEWNYTTRGLAAICKEGVDSIGSALRELEKEGYLIRHRLRDDKGKITDTEYVIYERPQKPDTGGPHTGPPSMVHPYTENPYTAYPNTVSPCTENPAQLNKDILIPKKSNTEVSNIHQSIRAVPEASAPLPRNSPMDRMDGIEAYREFIMSNIEYDILSERYGTERMDEVVELMLETILSKREYIRIAGDDFPAEVVKNRMFKVSASHVEYVFDALDKNTTKVRNIKAYLLTALYNSPATLDSYYRAEVNHDLYGG